MNTHSNTSNEDIELINRVLALSDESRLAEFWKYYRYWRMNRCAYRDVISSFKQLPEGGLNTEVVPDDDVLNIQRRCVALWQFYQRQPDRYALTYEDCGSYRINSFARRIMLDAVLFMYREVLPNVPYSAAHYDGKELPLTVRAEYEHRLKLWEAAHAENRHQIDYCAGLEAAEEMHGKHMAKHWRETPLEYGRDPILDTYRCDTEHFISSEDDGTRYRLQLAFDDDDEQPEA